MNRSNVAIPDFQRDYGDWEEFLSIWQAHEDDAIKTSWDLYSMVDIDTMPVDVVEICLKIERIPYNIDDSERVKKTTLRTYPEVFKRKSLDTLYKDVCKQITGLTPDIRNSKKLGGERYNYSRCGEFGDTGNDISQYGAPIGKKDVYIVLATDITSDQLHDLVRMYRMTWVRPAFYDLYIVNKMYQIIEVV